MKTFQGMMSNQRQLVSDQMMHRANNLLEWKLGEGEKECRMTLTQAQTQTQIELGASS